jgi:hypothetical protein
MAETAPAPVSEQILSWLDQVDGLGRQNEAAQLAWKAQSAARKLPGAMDARVALGLVLAYCGRRAEALIEADIAFGLRRTGSVHQQFNLLSLLTKLGHAKNVRIVAQEIVSTNGVQQVPAGVINLSLAGLLLGDLELLELCENLESRGKFTAGLAALISRSLEGDELRDAFQRHQRIALDLIQNDLCWFDAWYDDTFPGGSRLVVQYWSKLDSSLRLLRRRTISERMHTYYQENGWPATMHANLWVTLLLEVPESAAQVPAA